MKLHLKPIALLFCLACCSAYAQQDSNERPSPAATPVAEISREILLTFTDRGLARTTNSGPGRYFRRSGSYQTTTWSRSQVADLAREYSLNTVLEWPIRSLGVHCAVYRVDETQSLDAVIAQLRSDSRVKSVQHINTFRALTSGDPYKPLQASFRDMRVEAVHRQATGAGISIAIVDTGVDVDHPDLVGQVAEQVDLTGSDLNFEDDIHGTAIAGIIGALSENGIGIEGVAPNSRLFALRACWPEKVGAIAAVCNSLTLARALDTAISLKTAILNLSLTGPADPLITELLQVALRDGIIIVAAEPAAGSEPGFIAGIDEIIRVRSSVVPSAEKIGSHPATAISAPGSDVLTTFPHGTYNFTNGSSFAAANVSGVIALLLELQPGLSSREVRELLSLGMSGANAGQPNVASTSINVCQIAAQLRPGFVCDDTAASKMLVRDSSAQNPSLLQ